MHLYLRLMKRDGPDIYSASERAELASFLEASPGVQKVKSIERHPKGGYVAILDVDAERHGELADHVSSHGLMMVMQGMMSAMRRRITKINDTFLVTGRGLIVVPGPKRVDIAGGTDIPVELRRPDGTRVRARASLTHTFQSPPPPPHIAEQWTCTLFDVSKEDVPLGTEIWGVNAV